MEVDAQVVEVAQERKDQNNMSRKMKRMTIEKYANKKSTTHPDIVLSIEPSIKVFLNLILKKRWKVKFNYVRDK